MSSEHDEDDDLRPEYDLTEFMKRGVRGKYVDRFRADSPSLPVGAGDDDAHGDDDHAAIVLTAEQEAELEAASAEIKRGNFLTPAELFDLLKRDREGASSPL